MHQDTFLGEFWGRAQFHDPVGRGIVDDITSNAAREVSQDRADSRAVSDDLPIVNRKNGSHWGKSRKRRLPLFARGFIARGAP